jgi:hypothetical protein
MLGARPVRSNRHISAEAAHLDVFMFSLNATDWLESYITRCKQLDRRILSVQLATSSLCRLISAQTARLVALFNANSLACTL